MLRDWTGEVSGTASIGADVTDRRRAEEQLQHDAFHDALTGLPNRALFIDRLQAALARLQGASARPPQGLFAVVFLDVDRFKLVNDSLGHSVGRPAPRRAQHAPSRRRCGPGDTVARLGGDEFTILLEDMEEREEAVAVAERIQAVLREPLDPGRPRGLRHRQHRHRALRARLPPRGRPPARRRHRDVPRQGPGQVAPPGVRLLDARARAQAAAARARPAPRHRAARVPRALPAHRARRGPADRRVRGPGALAASRARAWSRRRSSSPWPRRPASSCPSGKACCEEACRAGRRPWQTVRPATTSP